MTQMQYDAIHFCQDSIGNKYPNVREVWADADGLKSILERDGSDPTQTDFTTVGLTGII